MSVAEEKDAVCVAQGGVEVVEGEDGGHVVGFDDVADQGEDTGLVFQVQAGGGFVHEEEVGFLGQGPGDADLLQFAAAHLVEGRQAHVGEVEMAHDGVDFFDVVLGGAGAHVGDAAHEDGVEGGDVGRLALLGHVGDFPGDLSGGHGGGGGAPELDLAVLEGEDAVEAFEQGGFSSAVGAEDGQDFPLMQAEINGGENFFGFAGVAELVDLEDHGRPPWVLVMR